MRREGRRLGALLARALAAALAAAALPASAAAAVPPRVPALQPAKAVVPQPTVDHPPVDGVGSFDYGSRAQNKVALTFDADMTPGMLAQLRAGQVRSWYNQDLRDLLDAEHIRSTIFLTGLWAETYPDVARSLAADRNFELGDHTYDHAAFRTPCYGLFAAADRAGEISRAQGTIERITGVRPALLRFPGDCYDRSDQALAQSEGLLVISGDVRAGDGFNNNAAAIAATVLSQLRPGSIVVMHFHGGPNAPMTAPAVRQIIQGARARGLDFGTVSEVLARTAAPVPAAAAGPTQRLAAFHAGSLGQPGASPSVAALYRFRSRRLAAPLRPFRDSGVSLLA